MKTTLLICIICIAGCGGLPDYFYQNTGKITYQDNLDHPYNDILVTVYGYTELNGDIYLKRLTALDRLLTLGIDIKRHEQAHSFYFIIQDNRPAEWLRFHQDWDGNYEDFAQAVMKRNNKAVNKFIKGGYR